MASAPKPHRPRPPRSRALVAALLSAAAAPLSAQPVGAAQPFAISAGASLTATATDNQGLTSDRPRAEAIVQPSLSVRMDARGGRVQGFLDYSLTGVVYTRDTAADDVRNALNAFATAEVVEGAGFVDVAASVGQQLRSAFGVVTPDPALGGDNRVEVTTLRLTPYLRGRLGDNGRFEARLSQSETRSRPDAASDVSTTSGAVSANGGTPLSPLSWSTQLSGNIYDFSTGRRTTEAVLRAVLGWAIERELVVSAIAGGETNNFRTVRRQGSAVYGARLQWQPGPRTSLSAESERRSFGNSHSVSFSHRMPRTAVLFSDSRSVGAPDARSALGSLGSAYDVLFVQYASIEPDPAKRKALVLAILAANGIDPLRPVLGDFLTSSVTLQRRQDLAFSWIGVRDTVTLSANRSDRRRADTLAVPATGDDFASTDIVRQRGVSLSVSHRLTPQASLSLDAAVLRTSGSLATQQTTLRSAGVQWVGRVGARTDLSLGARHAEFDSTTQPYQASTLSTTLRLQF